MNILYVAFKDFSKLHYGASKKVISECRAFEQMGHSVTLIGRNKSETVLITTDGKMDPLATHKPFFVNKLRPLIDKNRQIADIIDYVSDKKFDFCYIRYDLSDGNFVKMLREIHRICKQIFIEIPTYPYDREYAGKINAIRLKIDEHYGKQLKKYVSKIVTFYPVPNNMFFGIPCIHVPNGFDFDGIDIVKDDFLPDTIHVAAVSSMRQWHGYERMIEGLHRYYSNGGTRHLVLHLAGDGRELTKYKKLCEDYSLSESVVFHGAIHGKELDMLLEQCTLAVDSLGRHRTGVDVLSSLKSREYGAKGIPFINSCKVDIVDADFPYMLEVPADETPVIIDDVIAFYDKIYQGKRRSDVAREIRTYIESKSNIQAVMKLVESRI